MGNPVVREIQSYRKTLIFRIKTLTYLDDRPVFDSERKQVEAWAEGGIEAERAERERQREEEREQHRHNFLGKLFFSNYSMQTKRKHSKSNLRPHLIVI
jgi:dynein assembly factor 1